MLENNKIGMEWGKNRQSDYVKSWAWLSMPLTPSLKTEKCRSQRHAGQPD